MNSLCVHTVYLCTAHYCQKKLVDGTCLLILHIFFISNKYLLTFEPGLVTSLSQQFFKSNKNHVFKSIQAFLAYVMSAVALKKAYLSFQIPNHM